MNPYHSHFRRGVDGPTWPIIASGLWLRVGFVGASAVVVAMVRAFDGEASLVATLAIVIAGVAVAVLAWRQGWRALDRADHEANEPPSAADAPRASDKGVRPAYRLGPLQHD